ncbi:MAG: protein-L-isoaspartate(D-aspartate) O-methyltransferase [Candidatus Omnitrophica bacterium]|nr:protein-L-isoaspartate(D-aspartate) O-methyltransferase [Candidatus Omnitrophota bacterium]MCF7893604.1 protein-L-isoaspartate(D-aspartate) O-methyltransferase [Candidatus Omnitrophota bacterium]
MDKKDFKLLRQKMVSGQLASRGIDDPKVLQAFREVPREIFVPEAMQEFAYQDSPLSIGGGQTISQPYIVALMTKLLEVKSGDKILEVGTGSGYQAAILLNMGAEVYGVERHLNLGQEAKEKIKALGYAIEVKIGDGTLGWNKFAPYHKIVVTAAAPKLPQSLFEQLAVGGRLVVPVGSRFSQELTVVVKKGKNELSSQAVCGCVFVPLIGQEGWDESG